MEILVRNLGIKDIRIKVQIDFTDDGEEIKYYNINNRKWCENISQIQNSQSFQDEQDQKNFEFVIKEIKEALDDPEVIEWVYDFFEVQHLSSFKVNDLKIYLC